MSVSRQDDMVRLSVFPHRPHQLPDLTRSPGLYPGQEGEGVGRSGPGESVGGVLISHTSHHWDLGPVYQGGQAGVV